MGTRRLFFRIGLAAFLIVWLGITAYTLFAIFDPSLAYSPRLFALFIAFLDILAALLLWLWYRARPHTIQLQVAVATFSVILLFYWGFATIYSFFALNLDSLQLRWLAFAYIWEVLLVGAMVVVSILWVTRFADRFFRDGVVDRERSTIHSYIAGIPARSSAVFIAVVFFGYFIGSIQLYYFAHFPLAETIKNNIIGIISGTLSSLIVFFLLERIMRPALEKSGVLAKSLGVPEKRGRWSSLFTKIYVVSGLLALLSVVYFGLLAYAMGQTILEDQLKQRVRLELQRTKAEMKLQGALIGDQEHKERLGSNSVFVYSNQGGVENAFGTVVLSGDSQATFKLLLRSPFEGKVFVDRSRDVKIIGLIPADGDRYLAAVIFLNDFDHALSTLILYIVAVFFLIAIIVAMVGTLFARSITLPIQEIKKGSVRMGMGDFSHSITVYTNDELEDLSSALNEAARQLQISYAGLEETVRERTRQLEVANTEQKQRILELNEASQQLIKKDQELQEINTKLRELDAAKSQFVSIAAHQLRTPLSAIKWTFSMLLSGDFGVLRSNQKSALARARESVERIIALISDLLNVARIESGQLIYKFEPIQIEDVVAEVVEEMLPKAKEKGVIVQLRKQERTLGEARGDKDKLRLVFQNLLDNAVLYSESKEDKSQDHKVEVVMRKKNDTQYQVAFSDHGIGIPKRQLPLLFRKFFRADNAMRSQAAGTGLGLYIASRIVEAHGGTIEVESEEGKSSIFTVTLPFLV